MPVTRRALVAAAFQKPLSFSPPQPILADPSIHFGFPRLVRARNGHLLCFYRVGNSHAYDHSSIELIRSPDSGRTWSARQKLWTDPDPDRSAHNPVALVTSSGRILLWMSGFRFRPNPQRREPGLWTWSDDDGRTWRAPAVFDANPERSSYYMTDAIRTSDGLLAANATFPPGGVGNCHAVLWHAGGNGQWAVRSELTAPAANRGDEVALLETAPGQLLCLLRTRRQPGAKGYPPGLSRFISGDGGRTWTEEENMGRMLGLTLQRPCLTRLDAQRVLLSGRNIETREVVAFVSFDNARTFTQRTVIQGYAKDGAYTSCLVIGVNEVLMVYYADRDGALPDLYSTRLRIPSRA